MNLLIGREEDQSRLVVQAGKKLFAFGAPDSVPLSVSRYKPEQRTAHCRLDIDDRTHKLQIVNLNPANYTWVDGCQVTDVPMEVDWDANVQLGGEYYNLDFRNILSQLGIETPVAIGHLERIYTNYERARLDLQIQQQKKANQQRLQGILSQASMVVMVIPSLLPDKVLEVPGWLRAVLICSALLLGIIFFIRGNKSGNILAVQMKNLDQQLEHDYVCPSCQNFVGNRPYKMLIAQGRCPICGKYYRGTRPSSSNSLRMPRYSYN